jgi:hypothetical protein
VFFFTTDKSSVSEILYIGVCMVRYHAKSERTGKMNRRKIVVGILGFTLMLILGACLQQATPTVSDWTQREQQAYSQLSDYQKKLVDQGDLYFTGATYATTPGALLRNTGLSAQARGSNFSCPVSPDKVPAPGSRGVDYGTFYMYTLSTRQKTNEG